MIGIARSLDKLRRIEEEAGSTHFSFYCCDVSSSEEVKEISTQIKAKGQTPSFFYLNAGLTGLPAIESVDRLDVELHHKMFSVNYYGVLHFVEEWLQTCKEHGGATFILSSSINATFAPPGGSAYAASKAAISKAFDGLRLTHNKSNLKFLSSFCGPVDTAGRVGELPFTWAPE